MKHQALAKRHADDHSGKERNGGQSIIHSLQKTPNKQKLSHKTFKREMQTSVQWRRRNHPSYLSHLCAERLSFLQKVNSNSLS